MAIPITSPLYNKLYRISLVNLYDLIWKEIDLDNVHSKVVASVM